MPANKNNKRGKKSKSGGRKVALAGFSTPRNLFPMTMNGYGTYGANIAYTVPILGFARHVFRLNSIYDPDYTSLTGRSIGAYAQASALYGKYRVFEARIHIDFSSEAQSPMNVMCVASNDNSLVADPEVWNSQRSVYTACLKSGDGISHSMVVPVHTVYGVPAAAVLLEDDFASVMASNPNNPVYLHVGLQNLTGIAVTARFFIRIEFRVRLELPIALS